MEEIKLNGKLIDNINIVLNIQYETYGIICLVIFIATK